jgi:FKBP-type peptidyl-prolyl cis-trans isomerase SlyD
VALQFVATVAGVRAATAEEIAHRHVHGEHGHHH